MKTLQIKNNKAMRTVTSFLEAKEGKCERCENSHLIFPLIEEFARMCGHAEDNFIFTGECVTPKVYAVTNNQVVEVFHAKISRGGYEVTKSWKFDTNYQLLVEHWKKYQGYYFD